MTPLPLLTAVAYSAAFPLDIRFGICGNFAQILRPLFYGLLTPMSPLASHPSTNDSAVLSGRLR